MPLQQNGPDHLRFLKSLHFDCRPSTLSALLERDSLGGSMHQIWTVLQHNGPHCLEMRTVDRSHYRRPRTRCKTVLIVATYTYPTVAQEVGDTAAHTPRHQLPCATRQH